MSTDKGYIKLYRDIRDNWVWDDKPFSMGLAWIDLIMMVNHEDKKILFNKNLIVIKRGSVITSLRKLSERWGWHRNRVSRFLNMLESDGMITQKRDSDCTMINIVKYSIYQASKDSKRDSYGTPTVPRTVPRTQHKQGIKEDTKEYTIEDTKEKTPYNPPLDEGEEYIDRSEYTEEELERLREEGWS